MSDITSTVSAEQEQQQTSITSNGNLSYHSVGSAVLDYFSGVTRQTDDQKIIDLWNLAWEESKVFSILALFQKRDCRGGAGERKPFIFSFTQIPTEYRKLLYTLIPEYGYYDDLNKLAKDIPEDRDFIVKILADKLYENLNWFFNISLDKEVLPKPKHFGLLEKWLPTEKGEDDRTWGAVTLIIENLKNRLPLLIQKLDTLDIEHRT